MNKRGVVNRPNKGRCDQIGFCDGGHFAAVYPRKGAKVESQYKGISKIIVRDNVLVIIHVVYFLIIVPIKV